ncbi:MAG: glycosyltransferase [Candidatus Dormibacteria bacterium]
MVSAQSLEVVMVAFEGPDGYSQAGGLGVRARELTRALAARGLRTTLVFVGDPELPPDGEDHGVRLVRFGQAISKRHPAGVYAGEMEKVRALTEQLPRWVARRVVAPAAAEGRSVAVFAEEWHTAAFCHRLSDHLHRMGLRQRCAILWNANNTFGFERIDWPTLGYVAAITTVSRYMKHLMWPYGVNATVIPNGIPGSALRPVDGLAVAAIRSAAGVPCLTFKRGRWSPDKRWHQALGSIAQLRANGVPARMLMRGGMEPFGGEVIAHGQALGLEPADWNEPLEDAAGVVRALTETGGAPLVNLCRFVPDALLPEIDVAATAVLANSGHEPFGLVGLEAMAAGAVAVVGATGEEYARPYGNAIVTETEDPVEVASALRGLVERPALARRLRQTARRDAADFTWERVVDGLLERLRFVCQHQGVALAEIPVRRARQSGPGASSASARSAAPRESGTSRTPTRE